VGPTDVSVDRSTLTSQRSRGSVGPTGQSHPEADRWGPRSGQVKRKSKGARLEAQPGSAWLHGSARPAAQQAGLVLGLAGHVGWLGLTGRPTAHPYLSLSLSLTDDTGPGGSAPRSLDRRDTRVGLPPDLVWLPDPVQLGLRVVVRVCEC
jgi:hypothetical protein